MCNIQVYNLFFEIMHSLIEYFKYIKNLNCVVLFELRLKRTQIWPEKIFSHEHVLDITHTRQTHLPIVKCQINYTCLC